MLRIVTHIERLLLVHDCVIVPKFGGFVLQAVPAPEKKAFVSRPVVVQSKKMYHIVIASFPSESQADEFIAGVDRNECKHVSKVVRDGKYRIYADKFDNREAAESYMATLRSNPKYKDALLFISR